MERNEASDILDKRVRHIAGKGKVSIYIYINIIFIYIESNLNTYDIVKKHQ